MTNNVMVDIETLGKKAGCPILSIGACFFNPFTSETPAITFDCKIDLFSSLLHGFKVDDSTLQWWQEQDKNAQSEISKGTKLTVKEALSSFSGWYDQYAGEQFWCQGATFDAPILAEYYERLGIKTPWEFWNVRDTRTVYDIKNFDVSRIDREGTYHNALDDALHQVKCVQTAMGSVGLPPVAPCFATESCQTE
jgi:hypothetical protein